MKRIALFVDGANCYYAQKELGWTVDMQKLLDYCRENGDVVGAIYYTGTAEDDSQCKFLDKLAHVGYSLVTKPVKTMIDPEKGLISQKANMDVEIAVDMIKFMGQYDEAVLVSGDGDFISVIRYLQSNNKTVKVISAQCSTARELIREMGMNHIKLDDIREKVERSESRVIPMQQGSKVLKMAQ